MTDHDAPAGRLLVSCAATVASVLLGAAHTLYGHPVTAVGFFLLALIGVFTTLLLRKGRT